MTKEKIVNRWLKLKKLLIVTIYELQYRYILNHSLWAFYYNILDLILGSNCSKYQ